MRILITVPFLQKEFGGPPGKAVALADELRKAGHEVDLVGCGERPGAIGLPILAKLHATPIPRTVKPVVARAKGADVVHVIGYRDPVGTAAALTAARHDVPYVLEPVGMYGSKVRSFWLKAFYERIVGHRVVGRAAVVIATSRIEGDEIASAGISRARIVHRPNGVAVDELLPLPPRGAFRAQLGVPADAPLVLTITRMSQTKGLERLVASAALDDSLHVVIAGPDDGDGTFERLAAARAGLGPEGSRIHLLPQGVWGRDKAAALADADCFCLPSATESFGIAALEAAAVGVPVVVSDRCGGAEWLVPTASRIVAYGDEIALARTLGELTRDPAASNEARAAAADLRRSLDWRKLAQDQIDIYADVREGTRPSGARDWRR